MSIPHFLDGDYSATLGEAAVLRFSITADDPAAASLVHPNRIVLRDRWGLVLDRFFPRKRLRKRDSDALFVHVEAHSLIAGLAKQPVLEYSLVATVQEHVAWLLAQQVGDAPYTLGVIDEPLASYELLFEASAMTVLAALNELRSLLPVHLRGHFYITNDHQFRWRREVGPAGRKIQVGMNLRGMEYSTNEDDLVTRLYMYGAGQNGYRKLRLSDAPGQVNDYVEANTGTYGIIAQVKHDNRILWPQTLLAKAQAIISEFSTPAVEITVDVLDLAMADTSQDLSEWGDYYVGGRYLIEDPQQDIEETVTVAKVDYDLANPVPVKLSLSNRQRTLADVFRDMDAKYGGKTDVTQGEGDTYNNITRIFTGGEIDEATGEATDDEYANLDYREGDLRGDGQGGIAYRQQPVPAGAGDARGGRWVDLVPSYTADTLAELPNDTDVPPNAIGRVEEDPANPYVRNGDNDGWLKAGPEEAEVVPEPIALEADVGLSLQYAKADHVHAGLPLIELVEEFPTDEKRIVEYEGEDGVQFWLCGGADGPVPLSLTTTEEP
jgi:hypothetical protein